jgi:hypothetical protein
MARDEQPIEHRCARYFGPYGRSAIPCPADPATDPLARAKAFLAKRDQINQEGKP